MEGHGGLQVGGELKSRCERKTKEGEKATACGMWELSLAGELSILLYGGHRKGPETTQKYGKAFEFKFPHTWETLVA